MKLDKQFISGNGLNVPQKMEYYQLGYLLHLIQVKYFHHNVY